MLKKLLPNPKLISGYSIPFLQSIYLSQAGTMLSYYSCFVVTFKEI